MVYVVNHFPLNTLFSPLLSVIASSRYLDFFPFSLRAADSTVATESDVDVKRWSAKMKDSSKTLKERRFRVLLKAR